MKPGLQRGAAKASDYHYRRALTLTEMLPAFGVAAGVGAAAFYVVRLFLQRTPLVSMRDIPTLGPVPDRTPRGATGAVHRSSSGRALRKPLPALAPPPTITRRNARRVDAG